MWITVLTNLPDQKSAEVLAFSLVEARLAACVNILPPIQSVYQWKDQIENASEIMMLIKTTQERYPAVEESIFRLHPYEVPEIIALPIVSGLPAYLSWIEAETSVENNSIA